MNGGLTGVERHEVDSVAMSPVKCILGIVVLLTISAWTEAGVLREEPEQKEELSVSELLELANKDLDHDGNGVVDGDGVVDRDSVIVEGDIVERRRRNADRCVRTGCKWRRSRNGKVYVPYVIANHYSPSELAIIRGSLNSFAQSTCIRFISRTYQRDYLHIKSLGGCYSSVGRRRNAQTLSLKRQGCIHHKTIQHELLHALGFHHEQSRSDRDKHIRVLWQNVRKEHKHNFNKRNTLNQGTPYDYNSIMHYNRLAFSKDGRSPTMVAVPNPNRVFGTAKQMSPNDINRVNLLYCR